MGKNNVPSQVEEAAELAEKLHKEMFQTTPIVDDEPVEDTPVEDEPVEDEPVEEELDTPHDDELDELRKFKARYLTLKGKYDAEVPQLHATLKEFKQTVFDKFAQMAENPPQTKQEVVQEENKLARFKELYGDEFIDDLKSLAEQIADEKIKASISPVQDKVASVEDTQIKVAQENFVSYLDSKIEGEWQNLWQGKDAKFNAFLTQTDPSGYYTNGELLQLYNDNWDADKIAVILNSYLTTSKAPEPKPKVPNPARDAMVAPSRTTTHTSSPETEDVIIWTTAMVKDFERQDRQGKLTPEESKRKWDDLLKAPSEGRFRSQ